MQTLKFSTGNAKLSKRLIFSLPAGHSCPWAGSCRTYASRADGTIIDHPTPGNSVIPEFRCFAAMAEVRPNVRNARWYNWDLIRSTLYKEEGEQLDDLIQLIDTSMTVQKPLPLVRVHESGDFWTDNYFRAWMAVAANRPKQIFYAYTKALTLWYNYRGEIPDNFKLTASYGGRLDDMITQFPDVFTRYSRVVYTQKEADDLGLSVDHDDSYCLGDEPFALLVHGSQRAGSEASQAIAERKRNGSFVGYGEGSRK
jgi:hypothetical protein